MVYTEVIILGLDMICTEINSLGLSMVYTSHSGAQ